MCRAIVSIASAITIATLSAPLSAHAVVATLEADNGAVYQIVSILRPYEPGYPINVVVTDEDQQVTTLNFDCMGHFSARVGFNGSPWRTIPSRSVAAKIAQIACAQAKR